MMEKYPTKRAYAKPKLVKFLKEKEVYKQFLFNCKNNTKKKTRFNEDLWMAFPWSRTNEGHDFWETLAKEYDEQT